MAASSGSAFAQTIDDEEPRTGDESQRVAALTGHGECVDSADHGRTWRPYRVGVDWRPYSRGRWRWRSNAWTWVSDFSWGWVPFHYGRWALDPAYGWVWIPGNVWGPAWVSWSYTDAHIGWAALPPWAPSFGIWRGQLPASWWCFADRRGFRRRRFRPQVVPYSRNPRLIRTARRDPPRFRRPRAVPARVGPSRARVQERRRDRRVDRRIERRNGRGQVGRSPRQTRRLPAKPSTVRRQRRNTASGRTRIHSKPAVRRQRRAKPAAQRQRHAKPAAQRRSTPDRVRRSSKPARSFKRSKPSQNRSRGGKQRHRSRK
ncbi:MAG: DUF6600 domain-containing protein [Myxococcota bacterium]